ncbi:MAG TPA: tRNA (adenosine(37)-N6)-dimethylallyltransferase MiaA [Candidatus Saccharimonadales bacterium]|nr:tRNA (adenosine(37)-N6)-dimethylallyltransferase MiaA [Candidatus Saccharimonadales bacterium]HVX57221.1 tRNA (adenosine(37)-N6)-dimethylallyltransferase MiaA [Candidatus Saccharimonadales bacterium]
MSDASPPLLVIVGETASGKSALALRLAERFDGELICADSWTARREVNIGTAKPSAAERAAVPHHLLDVVGPCEDFTAAVFKELAQAAIEDIAARGKLPIMVGGTGLYIDGVLYDYGFLPAGDRANRERFNRLSAQELLNTVKERGIEPGDVDVRNKRRLIRLLETGGQRPHKQQLRPNTLVIGLKTERQRLKERIERRVDTMLKAGLETEVRQLAERYGWQCEALKGVGYAQWRGYFEGADEGSTGLAGGTQNREETRQKIIKATLDLAKRQRTWFKRNNSIHWYSTPVKWPTVVAEVTTFLSK